MQCHTEHEYTEHCMLYSATEIQTLRQELRCRYRAVGLHLCSRNFSTQIDRFQRSGHPVFAVPPFPDGFTGHRSISLEGCYRSGCIRREFFVEIPSASHRVVQVTPRFGFVVRFAIRGGALHGVVAPTVPTPGLATPA